MVRFGFEVLLLLMVAGFIWVEVKELRGFGRHSLGTGVSVGTNDLGLAFTVVRFDDGEKESVRSAILQPAPSRSVFDKGGEAFRQHEDGSEEGLVSEDRDATHPGARVVMKRRSALGVLQAYTSHFDNFLDLSIVVVSCFSVFSWCWLQIAGAPPNFQMVSEAGERNGLRCPALSCQPQNSSNIQSHDRSGCRRRTVLTSLGLGAQA